MLKQFPDQSFQIDPDVQETKKKKRLLSAVISDTDTGAFEPSLKIKGWDDECHLTIDLRERSQGALSLDDNIPVLSVENGKPRLDAPGTDIGLGLYCQEKVLSFENPDRDEGTGQIQRGRSGLEWEIILSKKPASNVFEFNIQTDGLTFHYQPTHTVQELKDGLYRPEDVIGSYAVYHATRRNNLKKADGTFEEYKTGKAFHIYRPEAIDAIGGRSWCELFIDPKVGTLRITVPQQYLNTATYPLVIDPTFGYSTHGASGPAYGYGNGRAQIGDTYTASTGDTITLFTIYARMGTNRTGEVAAYDMSGGDPSSRLAAAVNFNSPDADADAEYTTDAVVQDLVDSSEYCVAFHFTAGSDIGKFYDTLTDSESRGSSSDLPASWTESGTATTRWSIWATYTEDAGTVVTPGTMTATASVVAPTVVLGNESVAPSASIATGSVIAPTAVLGNASVAPVASIGTGSVVAPTVALGSHAVASPAQTATASVIAPTVIIGSISIAPAAAIATGSVIAPTVDTGSGTTVAPPSSIATGSVIAPTVVLGSASQAPAVQTATASVIAPNVIIGSISIAPVASIATASVVAPSVAIGGAIIAPAVLTATASVIAPTILFGSASVAPVVSIATASLVAPTVLGGGPRVTPAPMIATASINPDTPVLSCEAVEILFASESMIFPTVTDEGMIFPTVTDESMTNGGA